MRSLLAFVPSLSFAIRGCLLLLFLTLQAGVTDCWAQQRPVPLPANARYGEMTAFKHPEATIGDKVLRLAPGAKVYNTQNLIVMPAALPQQASVLYRLDINGQIIEMWLLTREEAASAKKRPKNDT